MIKEKNCIKSIEMFEKFTQKWDRFTPVYDFRGPDLNIV